MSLSIIKCLKNVAKTIKNLATLENTYSYNTKTVASQYGKSFTITSVTLPKGYGYLILGQTTSNISNQSNILVTDFTNTDINSYGRGTMSGGGGCVGWGLVFPKEQDVTVELRTYGYLNSTYNITGRLVAIRLGKFIGGGYGVACTLRRWRHAVSDKVLKGCCKFCSQYKNYIVPKTEQTVDVCRRNYRNAQIRRKQIQRAFSNSRLWRGLHTYIDSCCFSIQLFNKNTFCWDLRRGLNICEHKQNFYSDVETAKELHCNYISLRQINSGRRCCCV